MRPGRELNTRIANEVFGYNVFRHKGELTENHPLGLRPLRNYSNDIEWAWEVAKHMKVTLLPTVDQQWFAFVGSADKQGWASPQEALQFLEAGDFKGAGAAVNENPCLAICMASLRALEKRQAEHLNPEGAVAAEQSAGEDSAPAPVAAETEAPESSVIH